MKDFKDTNGLQELTFADFELNTLPSSQPSYILSGSGFSWFYSDDKRTMVRVMRGTECMLYEKDPYINGKYIIQVGNEILSVCEKELIEIGWN